MRLGLWWVSICQGVCLSLGKEQLKRSAHAGGLPRFGCMVWILLLLLAEDMGAVRVEEKA